MLSLGIGCGCLGSAHAAVCLRAPGVPPQLRPRFAAAATRAARPPRVTAGEKEFPKKATSKRPARADASSSDSDDPSAPPPPPPPRVLPNSPVPVRYQMAVARVNKQAAAESAKPNLMKRRQALEGQSFRQPSVSETEHRQQRAERAAEAARLSKKESKHFALSSLYGSNTPGAAQQMPKVMLVDGYNVAHVWEVTKPMIAAGEMERARDALVEALTSYSHANRVRVVVAFDAMGGTCRTTSEELTLAGLTVAYCGDQEADSFIEDQVDSFLGRGYHQVVVATSDNLHADLVRGKQAGPRQTVFVVGAKALLNAMERSAAELAGRLSMQRPGMVQLGSAVKAKNRGAFETMQALRMGMPRAKPPS